LALSPGKLDRDLLHRYILASNCAAQAIVQEWGMTAAPGRAPPIPAGAASAAGVSVGNSGPILGSPGVSCTPGVGCGVAEGAGVKVGVGVGRGGASRATITRLMTILTTMIRLKSQKRIWLVLLFVLLRLLKRVSLLWTGHPL
jgi:hypothetical protein